MRPFSAPVRIIVHTKKEATVFIVPIFDIRQRLFSYFKETRAALHVCRLLLPDAFFNIRPAYIKGNAFQDKKTICLKMHGFRLKYQKHCWIVPK
jgi:hypothetical protein